MFTLVKPDFSFVECTIKHSGLLKDDKLEDIYLNFSLFFSLSLSFSKINRDLKINRFIDLCQRLDNSGVDSQSNRDCRLNEFSS